MAVISKKLYTPQIFVEMLTGFTYCFKHHNTVGEIESVLKENDIDTSKYRNFPLDRIDMIDNGKDVVLVYVSGFNPERQWEEAYHWFEVPEECAERIKFNSNAIIKTFPDVQKNRQHYLWNSGECAIIEYAGIKIVILACGDVKATLLDENKKEELCRVKDSHEEGIFAAEMGKFIIDDCDLAEKIRDGQLVLHDSNWWEYYVVDRNGKKHIIEETCLDATYLDEAVAEIAANIKGILDYVEQEANHGC